MIIPALDLIKGQVVRLFQGDFGQVTEYKICPIAQFSSYLAAGATWLHLVDLDGAKNSSDRQLNTINNIVKNTKANIQLGGGIRTENDLVALFEIGVNRVVIGSLAVKNPALVKAWIKKFGSEKIVLALDVNIDDKGNAFVAESGWQQVSNLRIETVLDDFQSVGIKHLLCTDISRDGTLQGSNIALYQKLAALYPSLHIQASGGIGTITDIANLQQASVAGVIVGRALLESKFTLEQAIAARSAYAS